MEGYMSTRTVNPPTNQNARLALSSARAFLFTEKMDVETFATLIQRNGFATRN
jgi:hypothetical protein